MASCVVDAYRGPMTFWFNVMTREVEEHTDSDRAPASDLLGPYPTRDVAERALETARQRTEEWEADEAADDDWGAGRPTDG